MIKKKQRNVLAKTNNTADVFNGICSWGMGSN